MIGAAAGLTEVRDEDLKRLLREVHRGEARCPLSTGELTRVGLQRSSAELLGVLRGLDATAVKAVLVAVIAERLPQNKQNVLRRQLARD